ncbi:MAG: hypothetical protein AAGB04_30235, partial [Pseudomonadota bacterium]
ILGGCALHRAREPPIGASIAERLLHRVRVPAIGGVDAADACLRTPISAVVLRVRTDAVFAV